MKGVSFVCHSMVRYMLWLQKYSKIFQKHNFGKVKVGCRIKEVEENL